MQEGRKLVEELSRSSDEDRSSASSHFLTKDPPARLIHTAGLADEALVVRDKLCRDSGLESSGPSVSAPLSLDAITPSQEPIVHNATLLPPSGALSRSRIVEKSPSSSSKVDGLSLLAGRQEMTSLLRAYFLISEFPQEGCTADLTIFPRRKSGQLKRQQDHAPVIISPELLEECFEMPLVSAATKLGL